ncbi:ComEA family DNA-binding protein [Paenibacillus yanchengensis]|uniref:ComEA family DNA-binding protein n=1 Tax=Paenibacillus yanchengensis TaxID=2035833 RepID=A0ABW4YKK1_9BACL
MRESRKKEQAVWLQKRLFPIILLVISLIMFVFAIYVNSWNNKPTFTALNELVEKQLSTAANAEEVVQTNQPTLLNSEQVENKPTIIPTSLPSVVDVVDDVDDIGNIPGVAAVAASDQVEADDTLVCKSANKIDINHASNNELQQLTGIGPAKATAIIEYRTTIGLFTTIEQLMQVKGIGKKIYERIKESIVAC